MHPDKERMPDIKVVDSLRKFLQDVLRFAKKQDCWKTVFWTQPTAWNQRFSLCLNFWSLCFLTATLIQDVLRWFSPADSFCQSDCLSGKQLRRTMKLVHWLCLEYIYRIYRSQSKVIAQLPPEICQVAGRLYTNFCIQLQHSLLYQFRSNASIRGRVFLSKTTVICWSCLHSVLNSLFASIVQPLTSTTPLLCCKRSSFLQRDKEAVTRGFQFKDVIKCKWTAADRVLVLLRLVRHISNKQKMSFCPSRHVNEERLFNASGVLRDIDSMILLCQTITSERPELFKYPDERLLSKQNPRSKFSRAEIDKVTSDWADQQPQDRWMEIACSSIVLEQHKKWGILRTKSRYSWATSRTQLKGLAEKWRLIELDGQLHDMVTICWR